MRSLHQLAAGALLLAQLAFVPASFAASNFVVNPYVQMGSTAPMRNESPQLAIQFGTPDTNIPYQLEWRNKGDNQWNSCPAPTFRRVATAGTRPFRLYSGQIIGINSGASIQYRVLRDRKSVFEGSCVAPKTSGTTQSFAVFGDLGTGTMESGAIGRQVLRAKPDYAVITGDIVYNRGTVNEYLTNFFPVLNASEMGVLNGVPLMSSLMCVATPGNHDLIYSGDLNRDPGGLAYFTFWSQPLNGPAVNVSANGAVAKNIPEVTGDQANKDAFLAAAGPNFPRMTQFSFDYGNAHWTFLDANPYMDWTTPELREWLDKDLASAKNATWRFVALHQPPFTSNLRYKDENRMRLVCDIFEKHKVDIVFAGHAHDYERSYPLMFSPEKIGKKVEPLPSGAINGAFQIDKRFDSKLNRTPLGVIYVVTGAGGAPLKIGRRLNVPFTVQPFTAKLIAHPHSFTLCDVSGSRLRLRQISVSGQELDAILIEKPDAQSPAPPAVD